MADSRKTRLKQILVEQSILRGDFTLASGKKSTYYIDARKTTLHPEGLSLIADLLLGEVKTLLPVDAVGGPTLGADPIIGAMVGMAHERGLALGGFIVRKQEKTHGTGKLIEGNLGEGDQVVMVEDVVTSGGSVLKAIDAVSALGVTVKKLLVVVDREEGAEIKFQEIGIPFYSIFKISDLL